MNKEELINNICELADMRHSGQFHIKAEVARHMISEDIDRYVESLKKQTQEKCLNNTHPYIWGGGWYAIPDTDEEFRENYWSLAPIKFFDEKGHRPDGWEWEKPEGLSNEEFDKFIDEYGCDPEIPDEFSYCMESTIECNKKISMEEQKQILKDFGYTVDNIPKWWYDRRR
jgi:hypothetical protein